MPRTVYVPCVYFQSVTSNSLWPHGLQPARLLCLWNFSGKNTRMGCHILLQGISPTQGSNPCLSLCWHWQTDSLPLHHMGVSRKPCVIKWIKGYNGQWASTFAYLSLDIIWDGMCYDFRMERVTFSLFTCNGSLEFHRFAKVVLLRMCLQLSQSMLREF